MVRLAATVMLVRPAGDAMFDVFMLRRSQASHFVPDAYVFPGGTLDESDVSDRALARTRGLDEATLRTQYRAQIAPALPAPFSSPPVRDAAGLLVAAVRELFEECGVLLACDATGTPVSARWVHSHRDRLEAARASVHRGDLSFAQLLEELDVFADATALTLFSQWVTPPAFPSRYNAHFFLARADAGQQAAADALETHDGIWIAPAEALRRSAEGTLRLVYPTIKHLERLAAFSNVDDLIAFARTKTIYSIMPQTTGDLEFALPPELESAW